MPVSVNCDSSNIKDNVRYVNELNAEVGGLVGGLLPNLIEVVGVLVSDKQMRLGFE